MSAHSHSCLHSPLTGGGRAVLRFTDGSPPIKARLVTGIRNALAGAGVPGHQYLGHSFRIDAATTGSEVGMQMCGLLQLVNTLKFYHVGDSFE